MGRREGAGISGFLNVVFIDGPESYGFVTRGRRPVRCTKFHSLAYSCPVFSVE